MSERPARGPSTFRQRDVTAALKAARRAGEKGEVRVVIEPDGKLVIIAPGEMAEMAAPGRNPWDDED